MIHKILTKITRTQILTSISISIALTVDSIIISKFLGTSAMAGYGAINPVIIIFMALGGVISMGSQILCAEQIGKGDMEGANRIVGLSIITSLVISGAYIAFIYMGSDIIALILGITKVDELAICASDYLRGYMLGAPALIGTLTLSPFMQLDGNQKFAAASMISVTITDIVGDILAVFVFHSGIYGVGVASAVSYYVGTSILLSHFILKKGSLRLRFNHLPWKMTGKFFVLGSSSAFQKILRTAFGLTINRVLLATGGVGALAAYAVIINVSNLANCCGQGISGAVMVLTGVFANDIDKNDLITLFKSFFKKAVVSNAVLTTVTIVFAHPIAAICLKKGADLSTVITGIRIMALAFFFYTLCMCLRNYYQGIKKTWLALLITFLMGYGFTGVFSIVLGLKFGLYGVCASYGLAEIATLAVIFVIVWISKKRVPSRIEDFLLLPDDFGIPAEDILELTVNDLDGVLDASEKVYEFAGEHGIRGKKDRRAMVLSLAVEELAKNVVQYGFEENRENHLDIRICVKDEKLMLRIRDDCAKFSPIDYRMQFQNIKPDTGLGISMISALTEDIKYLNVLGLNVVHITA